MNQDWSLLTKVPDLLMRGALVARLSEFSIEVYTPDRDVIVNVTSTSPNLSLEGYSAMFDGYPLYVSARDLVKAREVSENFQKEIRELDQQKIETDHPQKVYTMAVMSLFFPILTHAVALYHLQQAFKKKQKFSKGKIIVSIVLLVLTSYLGWMYGDQAWQQIMLLWD